LNSADGLLLATFGTTLLVNASLLAQICYLGTQVEGRTLWDILTADGRGSREMELNEIDNCDDTPYHREEDIALVDVQESTAEMVMQSKSLLMKTKLRTRNQNE